MHNIKTTIAGAAVMLLAPWFGAVLGQITPDTLGYAAACLLTFLMLEGIGAVLLAHGLGEGVALAK
jgi:hypothetical protein